MPLQTHASIRSFMRAVDTARRLTVLETNAETVEGVLDHANDLLDLIEDRMLDMDPILHVEMFEAIPRLRARLNVLKSLARGS